MATKKICEFITTNDILTFSLVDYRNNYFISDDPNKIIEFYNGFKNRNQLIQWMRERPKGVANIHEVDGDKEIIVVIPTADFNGRYARECREVIFKGLHIIFVESGEVPDPYFNYAHNVNVGIKKAMEYSPKWVVVSNDDMYKIDSSSYLLRILSSIDNKEFDYVLTSNSSYHNVKAYLGTERKFIGHIGTFLFYLLHGIGNLWLIKNPILKRYNVRWTIAHKIP